MGYCLGKTGKPLATWFKTGSQRDGAESTLFGVNCAKYEKAEGVTVTNSNE
jgi:hypothetical protein